MLRWFLAVLAAATTAACATGNGQQVDPCVRAIERLVDECGFEAEIEGTDIHCSGQSACFAVCLERSPCDDIAAQDGQFADCVEDC
jgi:hypothetical protein